MAESESGKAEDYISPNMAGKLAGVTGEAVKQWIYARKLPAVKLANGYWRISRGDLDEYLAAKDRPTKRRILVASTDRNVLKAAKSATVGKELDLVTAANMVDALMKARDSKPAVIFVDLADAAIEGLDVAKRLRSTRGFKRLPLIFLSTKEGAGRMGADDLLAMGAQGMLYKPVTSGGFSAEIDKLFPGA